MSPGLGKAERKCGRAEEWAAEWKCHPLCKCHSVSGSLSVCRTWTLYLCFAHAVALQMFDRTNAQTFFLPAEPWPAFCTPIVQACGGVAAIRGHLKHQLSRITARE